MKRKLALLLAMLLIVSVFAMGCNNSNSGQNNGGGGDGQSSGGDNNQGSGGDKRDDVIIYCENPWSSLDPHGTGSSTYVNMYLTNQLYESLTYVNDQGEVTPVLAKDWSVSDDGLVYTFNLEQGVKFHNGEEMKASDVEFSYNRAMGFPELETYYAPIEKVEATGDYTVDITLKYAFAPFLSYTENIPVVSEKYVTEKGTLLDVACGTGPYQLVDFDMNTECNMTRFDDYWKAPASIKDAKFKVITEGTTAVVAFESGELDFMFCFNVSAFKPLEESGKYNTKLAATYHTAHILMNNKVAPLDNVLVRRALAHATDRETMITIAYEGLASPTYLMANTSTFGVTEENFVNKYPYDLEKAKELLAEAGYPDGLNLGTMTILGGTYHEKYAQVFQQSLSQIGVTIELQASETAVADATAHDYVLCTMGNGFTSDFAYNAQHYTPDNMANYDNPEVTALFEEAAREQDSNKRLELYEKAIKIIQDDCPNIPIFNKQIPWVWNKNLNANPHFNSGHPYYVYEMSWN